MLFYGYETYKCKSCEETSNTPFIGGLCSKCIYKDRVSRTNSLCEECRKQCKLTALVSIVKCPDYNPKVSFKVPSKPAELSLSDKAVSTKKKPKKVPKQPKRKK